MALIGGGPAHYNSKNDPPVSVLAKVYSIAGAAGPRTIEEVIFLEGRRLLACANTLGGDIKASEGWGRATGSAQAVIAVIDSGVAAGHEDMIGKVVEGYNFVDDTVRAADDYGHGTFVASPIKPFRCRMTYIFFPVPARRLRSPKSGISPSASRCSQVSNSDSR